MKLFGKGKKKKTEKTRQEGKKKDYAYKKEENALMRHRFRSFEDTRKEALKIASVPNLTNLLPRERLAYAKILFWKANGQ